MKTELNREGNEKNTKYLWLVTHAVYKQGKILLIGLI